MSPSEPTVIAGGPIRRWGTGLGTTDRKYAQHGAATATAGPVLFGRRDHLVGNRQILIVDDQQDVRDTFRVFLQRKGFGCLVAEDALQALRAVRNHSIDLVLTDYHMPEINGLELLREVRSMKPDIPVILMSGAADMQVALRALKEHAFDFLGKPIDSAELLKVIDMALRPPAPEAVAMQATGKGIGPLYVVKAPEAEDVTLLYFNRPLDQFSVKAFDNALRRAAAEGDLGARLVLVLLNVSYVNSVGLNFFLDTLVAWQKEGKRIVLTQLSDPMYRYLKLLGHLDRFPNAATIAEAVATASGGLK